VIAPELLVADVDKSTGCVVLRTPDGEIVFYMADGKMNPPVRRGKECEACTTSNLATAKEVARAFNARKPTPKREDVCTAKGHA
jgi:hypothetical protein